MSLAKVFLSFTAALSFAYKIYFLYLFHVCSSIQGINSAKSSANIWTLRKSFPPDGRRSCLRFTGAGNDIQISEMLRPVF